MSAHKVLQRIIAAAWSPRHNASCPRRWRSAPAFAVIIALAALIALLILPNQGRPAAASEGGKMQLFVKVGILGDNSGGRLVPGSGHSLSEGTKSQYWVKLAGPTPTADVVVAIVSGNGSKVSLNYWSPSARGEMRFRYPGMQQVEYYALRDSDSDNETVVITHTSSSEDPNYDGLTASFTVKVGDQTPKCPAPDAPRLVRSYRNIHVHGDVPVCSGGVRIVATDYRISRHDGGWEIGSMGSLASPSYGGSIKYSFASLYVPLGYTYRVQTRGVTYGHGTTPWSPLSSINMGGPKSNNANLLDIMVWEGERELELDFDADTTEYTLNVANAVSTVEVQVAVADPNASVTVDGTTITPNLYGSKNVSLAVGSTAVSIVATAEDGETRKTYTVTVVRAEGEAQTIPEQGRLPNPNAQSPDTDAGNASLIAQMYKWRNDPQWVSHKSHTDRWDRALLAFGETVADKSLTPMTAAEAQGYADESWGRRWVPVAAALRLIESGQQPQPQRARRPATPEPQPQTLEPTPTQTPIPTATPTPEPTATQTPIPTATPTPTQTPTPTATPTPSPTPTVLWMRYDANGNGCIDTNEDEMLRATYDYADGKFDYGELLTIIRNRCE